MAAGSIIAAGKGSAGAKNILLNNHLNRFLMGVFMCTINPVQIPFWFGWSTVLFSKNILEPKPAQYNSYIVGIGLGTLMGTSVFIFGGKWMVQHIANSQQYLNWVIGAIFALTALIQLKKSFGTKTEFLNFMKQKNNEVNGEWSMAKSEYRKMNCETPNGYKLF